MLTLETTRDDHRIAWLAALAIAIHVLEASLPTLIPGLKPGLSNIITITVLMVYGIQMAVWVSALRVLVGSLLMGTFLTPSFMLAVTGTLCSLASLWLVYKLAGRHTGPVGYSVIAAMAHISGQFVLAYALFIPHPALWKLYPLMMTAALLLGLFNGIISHKLIQRMQS